MNNKYFVSILFTLLFTLTAWAGAIDYAAYAAPKKAVDALMIVKGYEWGPAVPKIIVEFEDAVSSFDKDTFAVKTGGSDRVILDVYNSDAQGNRQAQASNYLSFEFKVNTISMYGMTAGDANPFNFDMEKFLNTWATTYELELSLVQNKTFKVGDYEYGN
eukprot:jgi/Orpsp1_1/1186059/evm.model.c7180000096681.1